MSKSHRRRYRIFAHQKSWKTDTGTATSSGHQDQMEFQAEIPSGSEVDICENDTSHDLEKQFEKKKKKFKCLKAKQAECSELKRPIEGQTEEVNDLKLQLSIMQAEFNDLQKKLHYAEKQIKDLQVQVQLLGLKSLREEEVRRLALSRQVLQTFKHSRFGHIIWLLMDEAQKKFPGEFPKEARDLTEFVLKEFNLELFLVYKVWDVMKLVRVVFGLEFPHKKFGDLMMKTHEYFSTELPCEQLRMAMENWRSASAKYATKWNQLCGWVKLARESFPKESSHEKFLDLIILAYNSFPKTFPDEKFGELMAKALDLFPTEVFPQDCLSATFTGMVSILVNLKSNVLKDEELKRIDHKLQCLLDVATTFEWSRYFRSVESADFGKKFFFLCKGVAQSNIDVFHPKISGLDKDQLMQDVTNGRFRVENEDVGTVLLKFLNRQ